MLLAVEHIRRMRGGAQSHLMRCDDGGYYIVKFQNNPQHVRVLANEMLGTRIAGCLGLPVPRVEVVEVRPDLIRLTAELVVELGMRRTACRAGKQFGSQYPGDPTQRAVFDFLPDEQLTQVENVTDFVGMLVFDKWTCNTNGRQAVFYLEPGRSRYRAVMIDQGFCFNAGEWNFPDAPLRGLYSRHSVYRHVTGIDSFEPWLQPRRGTLEPHPTWGDCRKHPARVVQRRIRESRRTDPKARPEAPRRSRTDRLRA
jgi:hypothetical protein